MINVNDYASQGWGNVGDHETQQALLDLSQKLAALAGDMNTALGTTTGGTSAFRAYLGTTASFTTTGYHVVPYNALEYDVNAEFDVASGTWTPKTSGLYLVSVAVAYNTAQADQTQIEMGLYCNGSRVRYFHYDKVSGSIAPQYNGADVVNVTAGQTYQVQVTTPNASGGTPTTLFASSTASWFGATYMRATP